MDAKSFGAFIAGQRRAKNLTQADLAARLNVTDKAVSRWERGIGFPDISTIVSLASALETSVLELMKTEKENDYYLIYYRFRPYAISVTADILASLPQAMWEHVHNGGVLYMVEERFDEGKAVISTSKKAETPRITVDASGIISEISGSAYDEELFPEIFEEHIRNGGVLYAIGCPKDGKILVSTSKRPGGISAWMDYHMDDSFADISFHEIGVLLDKCIHTIKDMGKSKADRVRAAHKMSSCLVYCTTLSELDELTAVYCDLKEDNILGYDSTATCIFTGMLLEKYPK